jgi:dihydroorotase/N-acyl-D-amino-acid deacylase
VAQARPALNVAYLAGHNTIRAQAMGRGQRAPTPAELARMRAMVTQAMREGAFGLSTGLEYVPGAYATTEEIVALARQAAARGGIYTSHMRDEAAGVFASVRETIEIGRQAGLPVVITHHKVIGQPQWGSSERTLAMVDAGRQDSVDVMMDQYPYTATATGLSILIPSWALAGRASDFAERATTPGLRDSIVKGIVHAIRVERGFESLRFVQFNSVPWKPDLQGRTLEDWAVERGLVPTPETGAELIIEAQLMGGARVVYHVVDERDVQRIMRHPMTMIASDGALSRPGIGHPHPRSYGTFPRVLGRYVREQQVLSLEEAIHRMTLMPAARLGLEDRGRIAEGARADLVLFDPLTVGSPATFESPHQYPTGIPYVIVNGVITVADGRMTGSRAGMVLRHR